MYVTPEELRRATKAIIGNDPPQSSSNEAFPIGNGAAGISSTDTAKALTGARASAEQALEVVRGRLQAWDSVLTTSATEYEETDKKNAECLSPDYLNNLASNRVAGLGDFNQSSR
ncbi:type VII secretion target [Gordonia araii]|uniref:type VII secretion target n=1 Tax=Gordonia araii TaxID=263909 RepID=UPI000303F9DB|nr:type VII secretion target [Gordonia araii]NNG98900.1 hypothetical protein [Gordonia araii NBRC 100433]